MTYNNNMTIMFIIVIFCILSPYTFAADERWADTPRLPQILRRSQASVSPGQPALGIEPRSQRNNQYRPRNCSNWVRFHGFGDDFSVNFQKAQEFRYDYDIHLWAASFAYGLFRTQYYPDINYYIPHNFCERHVHSAAGYPYMSLRDAEFTCEGWINFYGHNHLLDLPDILHWIRNRDRSMDPYISIWAATFFNFMTNEGEGSAVTSRKFCFKVGHTIVPTPRLYPFMKLDGSNMSCLNYRDFYRINSPLRQAENEMPRFKFRTINDTYMTCEEWITECGYTGIEGFEEYLPKWTLKYVLNVRRLILNDRNEYISDPRGFCEGRSMFDNVKVNFYGLTLLQVQNQDQYQDHDQEQDEDED